MRSLSIATVAVLLTSPLVLAQEGEKKPSPEQTVSVQTLRLAEPLGGARKLTLYGTLGGEGTLVIDPNRCSTNLFGDDESCTKIALKVRRVSLPVLKIADPKGRSLHMVAGAGLDGTLYLVAPGATSGQGYRFIYETDDGRSVVSAELAPPAPANLLGGGGGLPILREVDGDSKCDTPIGFDSASVVPGIVNNTYFLLVTGELSDPSIQPRLVPRLYKKQPEYWEIDLVGCSEGGVVTPVTKPYVLKPFALEGARGTKGIKVLGKDKAVTIEVPPKSQQ